MLLGYVGEGHQRGEAAAGNFDNFAGSFDHQSLQNRKKHPLAHSLRSAVRSISPRRFLGYGKIAIAAIFLPSAAHLRDCPINPQYASLGRFARQTDYVENGYFPAELNE
jgi:hypothetical protein